MFVDFMKAHPFVTMEQYKWGMNPVMIKLMSEDNTHVRYLSENEADIRNGRKIDGSNLTNDLGIPVFN